MQIFYFRVVKRFSFFLFLISFFNFIQAQKPKLFSNPIVGSVTPTSAKVWIGYRGNGNNAIILGDTAEKIMIYPSDVSYIKNSKGHVALTMTFNNLKPDRYYYVLVNIDGWGTNGKVGFRTPKDTSVSDFNFITGSCLLLQTDIFRPIFPGASALILKRMRKKQGDFMLWLGDNLYMWKPHYESYEGMFKRYMSIRRKFKSLNNFIGNQPHYAIWDDHDYGPNDAGGEFVLKDSALKVFKGFWPNTYPEAAAFNGNYFKFSRYDADFFMMDNRYFRGARGDSSAPFLGETQLLWLKQQLLTSEAAFKFIAIGSQVVSRMGFGEKYNEFSKERSELFDFIVEKNVKGVIFLSGDMHFTELCKEEWKGYPLYDYSCSPLTSPPLPVSLLKMNNNPLRVAGTKFAFRNFGRISISGEAGNRVCTMETFNRRGKKKWSHQISQNELKVVGLK